MEVLSCRVSSRKPSKLSDGGGACLSPTSSHPSTAFDLKQIPGFAVRRLLGICNRHFPVAWRLRNLEGRGSVAHINADVGLFRFRQPDRFQQLERQRTLPGSIDEEISAKRPDRAIDNTAPDLGDRAIVCCHQLDNAAAVQQHDVVQFPETLSHDMLDQRPGHRETRPAEVALRKRVVTRHFQPELGSNPGRHRPSLCKIPIKAWKKFAKSQQPAGQKSVQMPRLRYARPSGGLIAEFVPFQHRYMVEVSRERRSRRQAANSSADDNGVISAILRHQRAPPEQRTDGCDVRRRTGQPQLLVKLLAFISNSIPADGSSDAGITSEFH